MYLLGANIRLVTPRIRVGLLLRNTRVLGIRAAARRPRRTPILGLSSEGRSMVGLHSEVHRQEVGLHSGVSTSPAIPRRMVGFLITLTLRDIEVLKVSAVASRLRVKPMQGLRLGGSLRSQVRLMQGLRLGDSLRSRVRPMQGLSSVVSTSQRLD